MELRHIRYFVALADKLNFTQAARQMHVSQSTLSHQIRQLEDELGETLINRDERRVTLTPAGQLFLAHGKAVLAEIDHAVLQMKHPSRELRGQVRVGAPPSLCIALLPQSLASFFHSHPGINVRIEEMTAIAEIQRRLVEETLDIGLFYPPVVTDELSIEPLYEEQAMLLVRRDHPLARRKKVRLVDLHGQRVCMPYSRIYRQVLEGFLRSVGAQPEVVLEIDGFGSLPFIVAHTDIAAIVPAHAVPPSDAYRVIPIESPVPTRVPSMCLKRNRRPDPAVNAFAAAVRQLAALRRKE